MIGRLLGVLLRNPTGVLAAGAVAVAWGAISVNAVFLQDGPHPAPFLTGETTTASLPEPKPVRVSTIDPARVPNEQERIAAERRARLTRDLQGELAARNFYNGGLDGRYGPQTEAAILSYEQAAGLQITGAVTDELLAHVRLSTLMAPPQPRRNPLRDYADTAPVQTVALQTGALQTGALRPAETPANAGDPAGDPVDDPVGDLLSRADSDPVTTATLEPAPLPAAGSGNPPASDGSATPAPDPDPQIVAVQEILADLGYAPGSIDGFIGPATKRAIEDFEIDRGLDMTGRITPALLQELTAVSGVPFT